MPEVGAAAEEGAEPADAAGPRSGEKKKKKKKKRKAVANGGDGACY